jgi:topoisomerase IV subunit A
VGMICGRLKRKLLLATSNGFGFTCSPEDLLSRTKAGKQFVSLEEGHSVLAPNLFDDAGVQWIASISEKGRLLVFPIEEMKHLPAGGKGVIVMGLDEGEQLVAALALTAKSLTVAGTGRGGKATEIRLNASQLQEYIGKRARKGKLLPHKIKPARAAAQD